VRGGNVTGLNSPEGRFVLFFTAEYAEIAENRKSRIKNQKHRMDFFQGLFLLLDFIISFFLCVLYISAVDPFHE